MPVKVKIKGRRRSICLGDLDKRVKLHTRVIKEPTDGEVDFTEVFDGADSISVWAMIKTVTGKTIFDGVNSDVNVTHEIYIRFREGISSETWIEFKGQFFKVFFPENLEERDQWLKLSCTIRGLVTSKAAQA